MKPTVSITPIKPREIMKLTGHGSIPALYRWLNAEGIKPLRRGVYREETIKNKLLAGEYRT